MDVNSLLQCFGGTLDQNADVRKSAESHLKELSKVPGFLGACLDIIASDEVPPNIRMAASLYFKNKISYGWNASTYSATAGENDLLSTRVDNDEKPVVKDMLVKALLQCAKTSPNCLRVLKPALNVIIGAEYPKGQWDDLLPNSLQLLSSDDIDATYIGLMCIAGIFSTYRWIENDSRQGLETLILQYFPDLLLYANDTLLQDPKLMEDPKVGELLRLILKIYKYVTYYDLPFTLQRPESFIPWANLFVKIIQLELPPSITKGMDPDQRKTNPWVKCKKWAFANLYRLFQRYASISLSKKFDYAEFRSLYLDQFLPQLLNALFDQIERWGNGQLWLSDESIYYCLNFLEQSITQREPWKLVSPHYTVILRHVIFPLLCPNEETLDSFENDPQEYIHRNLEFWNDDYSPDLAAVSLLVTAVNKRGKTTLQPTLEFIVEKLQSNCGDFKNIPLENAIQIESTLKIFSSICDKLMSKNFGHQDEILGFLKQNILPFFDSPYGFLKARVCEICSKLGGIKFKDEDTIQVIYNGVMGCLNSTDGCLPINLSAALALQTFIQDAYFQQAIIPVVIPVMQKLLSLSEEFESDTISGVMQEFVEQFSEQLQPFGVELMNNLVQQFLKLAIDLNEAANIDPDTLVSGEDIPDEGEKQMAALGVLSTVISILLSFENSLDVVRSLEQSFYPAAEFILKNDFEDFYRELCEFFENSMFLLREVTPLTWKILELIGENNRKDDSMIAYYLEDFMLILNNVLVYGSDELKKNDFYSRILFEIYSRADKSSDADLDDLTVVFNLSTTFLMALGVQTPPNYRATFLSDAINAILVEREKLKENVVFGVTAFNVILASMVSAPAETLEALKQGNCFEIFFDTWLTHYVPNYQRTFDIKLSSMALLNIICHLDNAKLAEFSLGAAMPTLGKSLVELMGRYPAAERALGEKRKEFTSSSANPESFDDWEDDAGKSDEDEGEPGNSDAKFEEYISELKEESGGIKFVDEIGFHDGETFDDLEEDPLTKSVLDDIEIYSLFKSSVGYLEQSNQNTFQAAFGNLPQEQANILMQISRL